MYVIGVTGGIASGKSLVARRLGQLGARVLNADRLGHIVLRMDEVKRSLLARWGEAVFHTRQGAQLGRVDRSAVANLVFAPPPDGPRELEFLESVTHPQISPCMARQLDRWRREGRVPAAVLDAPVLYKAGWDRHCDRILFVAAPWEVRAARAAGRGWTVEQLRARQAQQPDLDVQRSRADLVIDNSGALAATIAQVDAFWNNLVRGSDS